MWRVREVEEREKQRVKETERCRDIGDGETER